MKINNYWYCNNDSEYGLNPLLKYINSNSDEENKAIIKWAQENYIALINPNEYSVHALNQKRKHYRNLLKKALIDRIDVEADDCSLRGFGSIKENKLYMKIYDETLSTIMEENAEKFELERKFRDEEKREEYRSLGIDPDCPMNSI